jgi:hypothetical protein
MNQLKNLADSRLINGCIYCGGPAQSKDHVPSRVLLEPPYPENLPVVGCCEDCNQGFSKDEEYVACFVEMVLAGSANPEQCRRKSIARALRRSPALQARLESSKKEIDGRTVFAVEDERLKKVMLKLARGHAAYELSQLRQEEPDYFWCGLLETMQPEEQESFNAAHEQQLFDEVGSRGLQRMLVTHMVIRRPSGEESTIGFLLNEWVDVQGGFYRYLAIDDCGCVVIRIVVAEYLACEVAWRK